MLRKLTLAQRKEKHESCGIRQSLLGRGSSNCKGPEAGAHLAFLKNSKEVSRTWEERASYA